MDKIGEIAWHVEHRFGKLEALIRTGDNEAIVVWSRDEEPHPFCVHRATIHGRGIVSFASGTYHATRPIALAAAISRATGVDDHAAQSLFRA